MISDWSELPLGKFIELHDLTDLDDRGLRIAAALADMTYEELLEAPLSKTKQLLKNSEFFFKKPKIRRAKGEYVLNGQKFIFSRDLNSVSTAQYIDFSALPKDLYHLPEVAAVFLIPEGHKYNDGYDMESVVRTISDYLSYEDYNAISGFFLGSWLILMKDLERRTMKTLRKAVKQGAATKEQLKEVKKNMRIIRAATVGCY